MNSTYVHLYLNCPNRLYAVHVLYLHLNVEEPKNLLLKRLRILQMTHVAAPLECNLATVLNLFNERFDTSFVGPVMLAVKNQCWYLDILAAANNRPA
jgi:hypothetical protein